MHFIARMARSQGSLQVALFGAEGGLKIEGEANLNLFDNEAG